MKRLFWLSILLISAFLTSCENSGGEATDFSLTTTNSPTASSTQTPIPPTAPLFVGKSGVVYRSVNNV